MKKLFTLLTLLVAIVTGAWGETVQATLFQWAYANTSSVTSITNGTSLDGTTGGSLTPGTTNDSKAFSAKDKISAYGNTVPNDMKAAGTIGSNAYYLKNGSGALSLKVELTSGTFQVGDIVQICATGNWNVSTANNLGGKNGDVITKIETGSTSDFVLASATIPEGFTASNTLYFARQDGTTCGICAIKITRAKSVSSKELTGININGSSWNISALTDNKATIATEYAGPPTVQFVYRVVYNDNSFETGKTENIVAAKNEGSYNATSSVLTDNVTLTFTNVSNTLFSMTNPTAPTEALASKQSSSVTATFSSGASADVYNGHKSNDAQMVYNDAININSSGDSYFKAMFPSALAEGDVIDCSNHTGTFYIWYSDSKTNSQTLPYTIPANSDLIGKKTVYVKKNGAYDFTWFTITRPKAIDSQTFGGVKKGETTLAETTDYVVNGTTITLTDAHKAIVAPTDFKLINHITYDDASTEDKDVSVELTQNDEFFEGSTNIGTTTYTVKVPVDASTPLLSLSSASGSITLNSYTPTGTAKVTVTGANLTNGTFNAPTADGVTISPASVEITDGSLNQEFTITSTATTAASTEISFAYTGATTQTYMLTYSKTAMGTLEQSYVTTETTWDWSKAGEFGSNELTANTDPSNSTYFLMANMPEITGTDASFNKQALMVMCQFPTRATDHYFQGNYIKFKTTVPGTVQVWFSNTSNRVDNATNRRFLYVNGTNSGVYTLNQTFTNTEAMPVNAGEVVINAFTGEDNATMVRINKIIFTPTAEPENPTTEGDETYLTTTDNMAGWRAFYDADNSYSVEKNTKVYVVASNPVGTKVSLTSIEGIPAGVPVILHTSSTADNHKMTLTKETASPYSYTGENKLQYTTTAVSNVYRLGYNASDGVGFYPYSGTPASGAVILNVNTQAAKALMISFGDETALDNVSAEEKVSKGNGKRYNLAGQLVGEGYKGIVIENGKKFNQ